MADKKTTSIAIFTITEGMNYGQRLQNYALQEVLMSFSDAAHEVAAETVVNTLWSRFAPLSYWQELDACFENPGFQKKKAQMPPMEFSRWLGKEVLRQQAFRQFDQENGHRSSIQISQAHLQAAANDIRETYDWGVVGSDQLWNFYFGCVSGFDFGFCLPPERRVAYAASFGVPQLPAHIHAWYRQMLSGLSKISVREEAGAALVKELSNRDAAVVPDPTLLLPKEIWQLVMKRPEGIDTRAPYLLVYDLRVKDATYAAHVQAIARAQGLSLILFPGEEAPTYSLGPAEFLYLVAHAAAVITDSFHGICFSLLFGKAFLAFVRPTDGTGIDMSSRFDTLLAAYGMEHRRVSRMEDITAGRLFQQDFREVSRILRERRKAGASFLEEAIPIGGALRLNSVALMRPDKCTGCTACAASCPHQAIRMVPDGAGFLHPEVDRETCTDCGRCLKTCPACTPMQPEQADKTFAADEVQGALRLPAFTLKAREDAVLSVSSSGGAFALLAQAVLAAGGVVIGAAMGDASEGWNVCHIAVETMEDLPKLQRSKYVQSEKGGIFAQAAAYLRTGRTVLFSGTGCEVQGLLRYLAAIGHETSHLLTADLICHGVPSPLLWQKYMRLRTALDGKAAGDAIDVHFKDKRLGWHRSGNVMTVRYRDGMQYQAGNDVFTKLFLQDLCLRDTCYHCPAHTKIVQEAGKASAWRPSDLTIGDFWGVERTDLRALDDDKGVSLVFAHSAKGREALARLAKAGTADIRQVSLPMSFLQACNPNIFTSVVRPAERPAVMESIEQQDGIELLASLKVAVPRLFEGL